MVDEDEGNTEVGNFEERRRAMETSREFVYNVSYTIQTKSR
jgi:hypothetical protein